MTPGRFIVFEGGEGTGKTTQARLLVERLQAAGVDAIAVREPGGTLVGEAMRTIVLDPASEGLDQRAELLLYEASRAQHVVQVIRPALAAGTWVVCDRFAESSVAYQGYGRGIDLDLVNALNDFATAGLAPALTVLIDLDAALGLHRATGAGADRLEAAGLAFHERVRAGYLEIAKEPGHVVVDGSGTVGEVAQAVWGAVVALDPVLDAPQGGR
ncbi:MAG: dTMP kinase [Coriobacteriia bacterium]|nr:dTMP kinase [Coriobacteriia bacterium]